MKIVATWMTLDELEGTNTRQKWKDANGVSVEKYFVY